MTIRFLGPMTTHRFNSSDAGGPHCQFLRHFGSQSGLNTGGGSGLMTPGTIGLDTNGLFRTPLLTERDTWIVQGAFRNTNFIDGGFDQSAGIVWRRGGVEQLRLIQVREPAQNYRLLGRQYHWEVRRGATVLGSSKRFFIFGWDVIWAKVTIDPLLANGEVEIRVSKNGNTLPNYPDGAQSVVINLTNVDTADTGVAGCDEIEFIYNSAQGSGVWDHIVVMDTDGSVNNDIPAEPLWLVHGMVPNSNGDHQEWSSQGRSRWRLELLRGVQRRGQLLLRRRRPRGRVRPQASVSPSGSSSRARPATRASSPGTRSAPPIP